MRGSAKPGQVSLNGDAAPQSGESDDPIVGWTTSGTARWMIDASGCLVIAPLEGEESGELGEWDRHNDAPWRDSSSSITSAKIEGQIAVSTAEYMFFFCSSLETMDLSGLDTSRVTDMSCMFQRCSNLESLDLSGLDTSRVTDMSCMFDGCSSLESLDLSGLDTSSVERMYRMFHGCSSLTSLDLSTLDMSRVEIMSWMFRDCSSLESLDLAPLDASEVENTSSMFYGCSSLTSLDLSGLGTSKVTYMRDMFSGCSSLTSLDLSGLDIWGATDMSGMFHGCSSLTSLDLSGLDISGVVNMRDMFSGCSSLTSLDLSGLDTSCAEDMSGMFHGCPGLRTVTLGEKFSSENPYFYFPTPQGENLTGKWLSSADGKAYAPEAVPDYVAATYTAQTKADIYGAYVEFGELGDPIVGWTTSGTARWMIDASGCLVIAPLEGEESGELDKWDWYNGAPWSNYAYLIISAKIEGAIVVSTARDMFSGCSLLTSLDLSGLDTSKATDMSGMFNGCSRLSTLDLSGLDTSGVEYMSGMFEDCFALRAVTLGAAFSFEGIDSHLPTPQGENLTGKWLSSADGKAYAPEAVPNNVAATYTAQTKADISGAVISDAPAKVTAAGSQLALKPVVTFNGERLVEGEDYTVSYGDNIEPGVGAESVTVSAVEGKNFAGSVTVFFDIEKKITFPDVNYGND